MAVYRDDPLSIVQWLSISGDAHLSLQRLSTGNTLHGNIYCTDGLRISTFQVLHGTDQYRSGYVMASAPWLSTVFDSDVVLYNNHDGLEVIGGLPDDGLSLGEALAALDRWHPTEMWVRHLGSLLLDLT